MPRITENALDSAVFLYRSAEEAEEGSEVGGSGFLVGVATGIRPDLDHVYAVTANHVKAQGATVVRLGNQSGDVERRITSPRDWCQHPAGFDIAACRLGLGPDLGDFKYFPMQNIPCDGARDPQPNFIENRAMMRTYHLGPGSEVYMVSRFINHDGKHRNLPIVRSGHIAMMPDAPIHNRISGVQEDAYLVEIHSISGHSGSATFVYNPEFLPLGYGPWLLGIDWGHFPAEGDANSGLTCVTPAWLLWELLMDDDFEKKREEVNSQLRDEMES